MTIDANAIATQLARQLGDAWNAANGEAFAAAFTNDADFVDIRGDHHRSRMAIAKGHQAIFDTIYKGSKVEYTVRAARVLGSHVIAHLHTTMEGPALPFPPNDGAMTTIVAVDEGGAWRIAAFHNTLRVKMGPPPSR